jgi:LmbE family N-acetylglucosaminyl deacetylase
MVTAIDGTGTAESDWAAWPAVSAWPRMTVEPGEPPLVVAPHPDDEILGVGGLLSLLSRAEVVAVTDGEASHPDSTVYTRQQLASVRREETSRALDRLGLPAAPIHRLGHPDGGIDEETLAAALTDRLSPGRWCLATWRGDGHPDHEAVGRAAARACAATGARLLEYPIWTWHWARPGDERVPWERALRLDLPPAARAAKAAAIAEFHSQIAALGPEPGDASILPPHILRRFARPYEVVFG